MRKEKYPIIGFRVSQQLHDLFMDSCQKRGITPSKLLKRAIAYWIVYDKLDEIMEITSRALEVNDED